MFTVNQLELLPYLFASYDGGALLYPWLLVAYGWFLLKSFYIIFFKKIFYAACIRHFSTHLRIFQYGCTELNMLSKSEYQMKLRLSNSVIFSLYQG